MLGNNCSSAKSKNGYLWSVIGNGKTDLLMKDVWIESIAAASYPMLKRQILVVLEVEYSTKPLVEVNEEYLQ